LEVFYSLFLVHHGGVDLAGRYIRVDGIRVYCHSSGKGDPLVLIHGFLVSHRQWDLVRRRLAQSFTVYAVDLPGFGESERPAHFPYTMQSFSDLVAVLLDLLGLSRVRLMGHSMGGGVALNLAGCLPERVDRVVAVDPALYPFPAPLEARIALFPVVGEVVFKRLFGRRDMQRYFRRHVYLDPTLPSEEMLQFYWERLNRPGGRHAAYQALRTLDNLASLAGVPRRVRCPVQIVWGEHDRITPLAHGWRLEQEIERSKLFTIGGSGHAPMEERPREFCDVVLPFLGAASSSPAAVPDTVVGDGVAE
jgi:pimeloyl-ACP methyl ester carboxylesterase